MSPAMAPARLRRPPQAEQPGPSPAAAHPSAAPTTGQHLATTASLGPAPSHSTIVRTVPMVQSAYERFSTVPQAAGLYNPAAEKDACGLAMVATLRGTAGHDIVTQALDALRH